MALLLLEDSVIHVRFGRRFFDVELCSLELEARATDQQIKAALAAHLRMEEEVFDDYVVDRHPSGNLTLRPPVTYQ